MAGSFNSCNPKKYDTFQHVNSATPMSYSNRTVAGTVKQCFEVRLAMISLFSLFPAQKKKIICLYTPFLIKWINILDFIHHLRLLKLMGQSLNLFVLQCGGEKGTELHSNTMSPPHLKMETNSVSETFRVLKHLNDGQCQKHWSVYHHQNPFIKMFKHMFITGQSTALQHTVLVCMPIQIQSESSLQC